MPDDQQRLRWDVGGDHAAIARGRFCQAKLEVKKRLTRFKKAPGLSWQCPCAQRMRQGCRQSCSCNRRSNSLDTLKPQWSKRLTVCLISLPRFIKPAHMHSSNKSQHGCQQACHGRDFGSSTHWTEQVLTGSDLKQLWCQPHLKGRHSLQTHYQSLSSTQVHTRTHTHSLSFGASERPPTASCFHQTGLTGV